MRGRRSTCTTGLRSTPRSTNSPPTRHTSGLPRADWHGRSSSSRSSAGSRSRCYDPPGKPHEALRQLCRGRRHQPARPPRRPVRLPRAQWRREDHDAADDRRHPPSHAGTRAAGRRRRAYQSAVRQDAARLHSRAALRGAAGGVRADELEGRAGRGVQPRHAPEADHIERLDSPPRVHRGRRADGGARPQSGATPERHLPAVRGPGWDRPDEHAHARGGGSDVRPDRHHPARQGRRRRHGERRAAPAPGGRREPRRAVPEADRRGPDPRARRGTRTMKQPSLAHVLQPKWRTALQRLREERAKGGTGKLIVLVLVGGAFWVGVFGVLYRILRSLRSVEELGPLIPGKMLGLILLSFISILVLSNVITALSSFFLAKDLDLLVSAPVDWLRLYLAKLGETLLHSSWMVALMAVPILTAYGVVYKGGVLFALYAVLAIVPMLILPAVLGSAVTLVLVNIFPARRTR